MEGDFLKFRNFKLKFEFKVTILSQSCSLPVCIVGSPPRQIFLTVPALINNDWNQLENVKRDGFNIFPTNERRERETLL